MRSQQATRLEDDAAYVLYARARTDQAFGLRQVYMPCFIMPSDFIIPIFWARM
jgi:hypothetical protein